MNECQKAECEKLWGMADKVITTRIDGMDKAIKIKAKGLEDRYVNRLTLIAIIFTVIQIIIQVAFLLIWLKSP